MEFTVNKQAFETLPKDLQAIVRIATRAVNQDMLDEYTARNNHALKELVGKHKVQLRAYPKDVLMKLRDLSEQVVKEVSEKDAMTKKVYESYKAYKDNVQDYHTITEQAFLNARNAK